MRIAVAIALLAALPSPALSAITQRDYVAMMGAMSACGLRLDISALGKAMIEAGIDPKNSEDAEKIGQMVWDETQRVFAMTSAAQSAHCQKVKARAKRLGL